MMTKIILLLLIFLCGCRTSKVIIPPKIKYESTVQSDSILFWRVDTLKSSPYYDVNRMLPLSEVKKKYLIYKGRLFDIKENKVVTDLKLHLRREEEYGEDIYIIDGLPVRSYYVFKKSQMDWKLIIYNINGSLDGDFVVGNYETKFKNGLGYWKDFFYKDYKNFSAAEFQLKEEGEVKNNFKYGEWKYYNKEGKIDSIKNYTLEDSVDIRFPHCIFNKKEPCY